MAQSAAAFLDEAPSAAAFLDAPEPKPSAAEFLDAPDTTPAVKASPDSTTPAASFDSSNVKDMDSLIASEKAMSAEFAGEKPLISGGSVSLKPIIDALTPTMLNAPHDLAAALRGETKTPVVGQENQPVITLPAPTGNSVPAGIIRGLANTVSQLTTPDNLVLGAALGGAPAAVSKAVGLGFGAQMAHDVPEKIQEGLAEKTAGGKAEKLTEGLTEAAMAFFASKHGIGGRSIQTGELGPTSFPEWMQKKAGVDIEQPDVEPHVIDALLISKEAAGKGYVDLPPEAQTERKAIIDSVDEQLAKMPPEMVKASEERVAARGPQIPPKEGETLPVSTEGPPDTSGRSPLFSQALKESGITQEPAPAAAETLTSQSGAGSAAESTGASIGPGAASAEEDITNTLPATSLKRAVVDLQRNIDGREEIPVPERAGSKQLVSDAEDAITNDPGLGQKTVDRVLENAQEDQQASPKDAAVMLVERTRLRNERAANQERAVDPNATQDERDEARQNLASNEAQIDRIDQASRSAGTAWSDFGRLYQQVMKDDYTLESLERKAIAAKAKNGEPMTRAEFKEQFPLEHAKIQEQAKRIAELEKEAAQKKADFENANLDADTKAAYEATIEDLKKQGDANGQKIDSRILGIAEKIVNGLEKQGGAALERIRARRAEGRVNSLPVDDLIDYSIYGAAKIARKGLDFTKWSAEMISDIGDMSTDVLKQVWDASNARIDELGKKTGKDAEKVTAAIRKKTPQTPVEAKASAKAEAVAGEPLSHKTVFDYVKALIESGVHGVDPLMKAAHEGLKEHFPELTERDVRRAFGEYGKVKFPSKEDVKVELAEPRRITQLQESIDRLKEGQDPLHTGLQREKATQQIREKTKELNELLKKHAGTPSPEKLASRDQAKQTALRNAIADLNDRLMGKELTKSGPSAPDSVQTEQLRAERDAMKTKLQEIEDEANPGKTPEQRYNDTRLKQVEKRTAELEAKTKAGDFTKPSKPAPNVKYSDVLTAEAKLEKVKREFDSGVEKERLKNRTWSQKFWDHFVGAERAIKLSSDVVLAKLTTAAVVREGFLTPTEEVVGGGISKVLPGLAKRAPREGGLNLKAEAKAKTEAFTSGMKDAWDNARFKKSELENRFGSKKPDNPSWYEYFGYLHGALKAPIKRAEFARSLEKRIYNAKLNGVDVNNVETMGRLAQEAYVDADRAIFMQDNIVSDIFSGAMSMAERSKKFPNAGPAFARIGRFLVPIVKVPTNIVGEVATGVHGVVTGGTRAAAAYIKGIESLPPEQGDAIMRQLKKGLVGNALLVTGYLGYKGIGGFYQSKENRDKSDVEADHFRVGKLNLPGFVSHSTAGMLLNIGSTFRRVDEKKGVGPASFAAGSGVVKQLPFVPAATNAVHALESDEGFHKYVRDMAIGSVIPAIVPHVAKVIDTPGSFPANALTPATKRFPSNDVEAVKAQIPGLRSSVPQDRQKPHREQSHKRR